MSRQSIAPTRTLSLTEELEKLEQSITLTLQEIDHNFSKAHRIVTTSIIPVVEQYAKHSDAVREGSKFWKQFFEASANVSLSSYEETAEQPVAEEESLQDTTTTETSTVTDDAYATPSTRADDDTITGVGDASAESNIKGKGTGGSYSGEDDSSLLDSPSVVAAHSTPRATRTKTQTSNKRPTTSRRASSSSPSKSATRFAEYPSPYEVLKREMHGKGNPTSDPAEPPTTPGRPQRVESNSRQQHRMPDTSMTPESSPFAELDVTSTVTGITTNRQAGPASAGKFRPGSRQYQQQQRQEYADPLLHRMLDRTFRIQATPHKNGPQLALPSAKRGKDAITTPATTRKQQYSRFSAAASAMDDSAFLDSPDDVEPPRLRPELFSSPLKTTPGVSVFTTAAAAAAAKANKAGSRADDGGGGTNKLRTPRAEISNAAATAAAWASDSDEEDVMAGISPPKTIQFSMPQSKLLQTPAREASRRIVEDLLLTAGADFTDSVADEDERERGLRLRGKYAPGPGMGYEEGDGGEGRDEGDEGEVDDSPSVVRKFGVDVDDSF